MSYLNIPNRRPIYRGDYIGGGRFLGASPVISKGGGDSTLHILPYNPPREESTWNISLPHVPSPFVTESGTAIYPAYTDKNGYTHYNATPEAPVTGKTSLQAGRHQRRYEVRQISVAGRAGGGYYVYDREKNRSVGNGPLTPMSARAAEAEARRLNGAPAAAARRAAAAEQRKKEEAALAPVKSPFGSKSDIQALESRLEGRGGFDVVDGDPKKFWVTAVRPAQTGGYEYLVFHNKILPNGKGPFSSQAEARAWAERAFAGNDVGAVVDRVDRPGLELPQQATGTPPGAMTMTQRTTTATPPDGSLLQRHQTDVRKAWGLLKAKAKANWGKDGLVETYKGVRIFRRKITLTGPDGQVVTMPQFYTEQKLATKAHNATTLRPDNPAVRLEVTDTDAELPQVAICTALPTPVDPRLPAPVMTDAGVGHLGKGNLHAEHWGAIEAAQSAAGTTVVAPTLAEMKTAIAQRGLAPGQPIAPDNGPGPAAGTEPIASLPGEQAAPSDQPVDEEAGSSNAITNMFRGENLKKTLTVGGLAVAGLILLKKL